MRWDIARTGRFSKFFVLFFRLIFFEFKLHLFDIILIYFCIIFNLVCYDYDKIKFDIKGRAVTDTLSFDLGDNPLQWVALASDLTDYPKVSVIVPDPALVGTVKSGGSLEGWVAFMVDQKDSKPVMVFDPDSGGATGRGKTLFFKLY